MADVAVPNLGALGASPASNDLILMVDVSDGSQGAGGAVKIMTVANLFTAPTFSGLITAPGGVTITPSSGGGIFHDGNYGTLIEGSAGVLYDVTLSSPGGTAALGIPTGTLDITIPSGSLAVLVGDTKVQRFGCNNATPQAPAHSGASLGTWTGGSFGFVSGTVSLNVFNKIVAIETALIANGILVQP